MPSASATLAAKASLPHPSASAWADLMAEDNFVTRHLGPHDAEVRAMLAQMGLESLDELLDRTVPPGIRLPTALALPEPLSEASMLKKLRQLAGENRVFRSLIGMGYQDALTAPVILRNVLENPGWYTQYTPYQAEISQGRLEALLNFQTMVADLTALPLANASLLDEATAAAEAMAMCRSGANDLRDTFFIARNCHPQTIAVVQTRLTALGLKAVVGQPEQADFSAGTIFGILLQYPATDGRIHRWDDLVTLAHQHQVRVVVATDILALTLLRPPGEFGADIAVGSTQRLGMPMGAGGPHAAFLATRQELARKIPGRIVGVSRDAAGQPALRLAIQTREQHIKRERATSNICTAQVLPAVVAAMHAVYHGPAGLTRIARRIHAWTAVLARGLVRLGHQIGDDLFFDTLRVTPGSHIPVADILEAARVKSINLRSYNDGTIGIALDERTDMAEVHALLHIFCPKHPLPFLLDDLVAQANIEYPPTLRRGSPFLTHPVFNQHHSETQMLRYIRRLESRDLSLTSSMIPLGSCTMKLNATAEMLPITWSLWADVHPFAPADQTRGYAILFDQLQKFLAEITGFPALSLQPNAGSQGEYTGLLVIRAWHQSRGQAHRNICLIPDSAHGTNPASAVTAGLRVVAVACDPQGNVDLADLADKARAHRQNLACLMVTYPSTHGVFEEHIRDICAIVHDHGGQVYMDGANMNAQVGLSRPADIGADVCHLNLHKTFCIPHGGGGPGMGPIAVAKHLAPFLPGHPLGTSAGPSAMGPVAAAPYGSASILTIPWAYIVMMGASGLKKATAVAILNANYMAHRLGAHYPIAFKGQHGFCAHEFIIDARAFETSAGVKVEDIAKRLMDYGFHAPTISWPEPGTMMIEPTESESRAELDRFCDALIAIRQEIRDIETGLMDRHDNPLKHAPHTAAALAADPWPHRYSREKAAFPLAYLKEYKFWPHVGRIDNVYGDRHLFCSCPPVT
jgi:glycine dehydrogenase